MICDDCQYQRALLYIWNGRLICTACENKMDKKIHADADVVMEDHILTSRANKPNFNIMGCIVVMEET